MNFNGHNDKCEALEGKMDNECPECVADMHEDMRYAGIPWSVIRGEKKLKDCFSKEYLDLILNRPVKDE